MTDQNEDDQALDERDIHELIAEGDTGAISSALNNAPESVNDINDDDLSVFEALLKAGFTSAAKAVIELDTFDVNHQGHNPLRVAVATGNLDIALRLLELGASPNYRPEGTSSVLLLALENEYFELAASMVKHGAEVDIRNTHGWTPLIWASMKGRQKAVEFLLEHGANIHACNNDGWNAVTGAYFKNRTSIVDLLLSKGAVFGAKYAEAALLSAYDNGYKDVAMHLLDEINTSPNISNENGVSLLAKAVHKGDWAFTKELLSRGADVNVMNSDGLPLIAELAKNGHDQMISLFLEHGADVNLASIEKKFTAMHLAACNNQVKTIRFLAQCGANINAQDVAGDSPLMEAAHREFNTACVCLLKLGANRELLNNNGVNAKQLVRNNGHTRDDYFEEEDRYDLYELLSPVEGDD